MEKRKLTRQEKYWVLYDVGNSAFVMLVSAIIPIYFGTLAEEAGLSEVDYLAYWGYAVSLSTILTACIGPVLGTAADTRSFKKPLFAASVVLGAVACGALFVPSSWLVFLGVFVTAKVGHGASLIFYDAMLTDVTEEERFDMVSSNGYAWGYIGSCIPFVLSLAVILGHEAVGMSASAAMAVAFLLNAVWWLAMAVPLLKTYRQQHFVELPDKPLRDSLRRLGRTLKDIGGQKQIFLYLLSFFFFIDGVYTIIDMATAYGSAVGLDSTGLLLALLLTQVVAFPCALLFSVLSRRFATEKLLKICIGAYIAIALFAIQLDSQGEFWVLAVLVGIFLGAIQALSRSYFAKLIPPEKSGEYFGIYDICGKGASFMGTTLVGLTAQATGSASAGVGALAVMFILGYVLFGKAVKKEIKKD